MKACNVISWIAVAALAACGEPVPSPSYTVNPQSQPPSGSVSAVTGGVVASADGLFKVAIAPHGFDRDVTLSVTKGVAPSTPSALTALYTVAYTPTAASLVLDEAVTVGFALNAAPSGAYAIGHTTSATYDTLLPASFANGFVSATASTVGGFALVAAASGPPTSWTCDDTHYGSNDGCDCGCGASDPDCGATYTSADCAYSNCPSGTAPDSADPTSCAQSGPTVPAGWTCGPSYYGAGDGCDCGCGVLDPDCGPAPTASSCTYSECPSGSQPSSSNPAVCTTITAPAGWTCPVDAANDSTCTCGCGAVDPACPANYTVASCDAQSGCLFSGIVDPHDPTQCVAWTCDASLYADGTACDCGCGVVDPDCNGATAATACTATHCSADKVLSSTDISACVLNCAPAPAGSGHASCTNHGYFGFGSSCSADVSACSDGFSYSIECNGADCVCKINDACVGPATNGYCGDDAAAALSYSCGWSLTQN